MADLLDKTGGDKEAKPPVRTPDATLDQPTKQKTPRVTNAAVALQAKSDSIARQKELYERHAGRGAWSANHTPLPELQEIAAFHRRLRTQQARDVVTATYYEIDSRAFRLAQELFVAPEHAVVPGDLRAAARTHLPSVVSKSDDPAAHSLAGLLFTRVTEQLAVKMGWLEDRKRTAREVIIDCNTPRIATLAKYVGECLRPLGNRAPSRPNGIVLVVGRPTRATKDRYAPIFKELGITSPPDATGTIWYTRQAVASAKKDSSVFPPQRIVQCFTNSFDALRKTHEEANQYHREKAEIRSLQNQWKHFSQATLKGWISVDALKQRLESCTTDAEKIRVKEESAEVNKRITDTYRAILQTSLRHFEGSIHREKRAVFNRLASMQATLDGSPTGRINPNPVLLRAEANIALQQLRNEDIRIKESYNRNDQALLEEQIKRDSDTLRNIALALRDKAHLLSDTERLYRDSTLAGVEHTREVRRLLGKLELSRDALEEIKLRPFITYRDTLLSYLDSFESHLRPGNFLQAQDALVSMFFVSRVFGAQRAIEELKVSLVRSDSDLSRELQVAKNRLHALATISPLLGSKQGIEQTSFNSELVRLTSSILDRVTALQLEHLEILKREIIGHQGMALEAERDAFRKKAVDSLKDFDPEQFLQNASIR